MFKIIAQVTGGRTTPRALGCITGPLAHSVLVGDLRCFFPFASASARAWAGYRLRTTFAEGGAMNSSGGNGSPRRPADREPGTETAATRGVAESPPADVAGTADDPAPDAAVSELYRAHHRSLVRLAALLILDAAIAEDVVQDAFVAMHGAWPRLRDTAKALSYLRKSVVNRSRSLLRHRTVAAHHPPDPPPDEPSAGHEGVTAFERSAVVAALGGLPARQREALVLRYYANLPEADVAKVMGMSRGAVKSLTSRGMSVLQAVLEEAP
jgi:RNA polymerase sigma-70 factor (sigma-E family)